MDFIFLSFIAGVLTVLAPCVLPLIPVIIGGSVADNNKLRPIVITASLAGSLVLFTLLLKASTALITIPQAFWTYFSAGIILIFAFSLLFPFAWAKMLHKVGIGKLEQKSNQSLYKSSKKEGLMGMIATGAALGPVFASCSPTYLYVLGTVLPASWALGVVYLFAYSIGLAGVMFVVAYASQRMLHRLEGLSDPTGWFKKSLGALFLLVGLAILTGYDKKIEIAILDAGFFDISSVEQKLLDTKLDADVMKKETPVQIVPDPAESKSSLKFPHNKPAPDFVGTGAWVNSEPINSITDLQGSVVLVDFWTYSCINCIRTLEHTQKLHEKYADQGLVIVGVHTPEFSFEHDIDNLRREVIDYGLTYPIVQDNDYKTWRNYNNRYWPAFYLIDKQGNIRYTHFGEGKYDERERVIQALLEA